jgi:hypothetical protein
MLKKIDNPFPPCDSQPVSRGAAHTVPSRACENWPFQPERNLLASRSSYVPRSADFQSAVSPISNRQGDRKFGRAKRFRTPVSVAFAPFCEHSLSTTCKKRVAFRRFLGSPVVM